MRIFFFAALIWSQTAQEELHLSSCIIISHFLLCLINADKTNHGAELLLWPEKKQKKTTPNEDDLMFGATFGLKVRRFWTFLISFTLKSHIMRRKEESLHEQINEVSSYIRLERQKVKYKVLANI